MVNVAINGFGRIGRMVFRKMMLEQKIDVVAINASYPIETLVHLIKYDTIHGKFQKEVSHDDKHILIDGKKIAVINERNPEFLPWHTLHVDIVIEATGKFNEKEQAMKHITAGAKKVVLTAPGKNEDKTIVVGVNDEELDVHTQTVISNASCTTNCLAPILKVLEAEYGIVNGLMTTVHSYTNDQKNIDNPHKDLRRARACGQSIIPTSTGVAKALPKVLPSLEGKIHGLALRVPTPNVSLVDVVVDLQTKVTAEEVNEVFRKHSKHALQGILDVCDEPLVSIDFTTNSYSSIIDSLSTMVIGEKKVKILAWYDNEWGYSCRVVDLVEKVASQLQK